MFWRLIRSKRSPFKRAFFICEFFLITFRIAYNRTYIRNEVNNLKPVISSEVETAIHEKIIMDLCVLRWNKNLLKLKQVATRK